MSIVHPPRTLLAAGLLALAAAGPVAAAGIASVTTATGGKLCRTTPAHVPDEHETVTVRCPGPAGWRVTMTYPGTSVGVALARGSAVAPAGPQVGAGYGVGPRIEWRGPRVGGRLRPQAAVLRLLSRDAQGTVVSALAVMRLEDDAACPLAWLDAAATPDAAARRLADLEAPAFRCGRDKPRIVGRRTALVEDLAARAE
ncbi:hypothetical protein [Labrys wisconsinensis]|uniref:Secreted protein n=1 Tax=Labrys wisconsinensis TaxID=425677 RepID=A0ABU0JAC6_9HYPH|nr:hypothetical protein [Labrys wisconsinensis]MDQ0470234.1 hypothetical protein [Labrys wisconsinensis]